MIPICPVVSFTYGKRQFISFKINFLNREIKVVVLGGVCCGECVLKPRVESGVLLFAVMLRALSE